VVSDRRDPKNAPIGAPRRTSSPAPAGSLELPGEFFQWSQLARLRWVRSLKGPCSDAGSLIDRSQLWWTGDSTPDSQAVVALTEILTRDRSLLVQRAALAALRGTCHRASIPGLIMGLRSSDPGCCLQAIIGVLEFQAREAVPDLIALLDRAQRTDFMQIREHAAQALVWMGDERALEPLAAVVAP
jgi:HEAT repeat protein